MKKIIVSLKAKDDLKEIGVYTDKKWGRKQRIKYLTQLNDRLSYLLENPSFGRKRVDLPDSPLSYHEARHIIFYRVTKSGIEIIRVLHESMDFPKHL